MLLKLLKSCGQGYDLEATTLLCLKLNSKYPLILLTPWLRYS